MRRKPLPSPIPARYVLVLGLTGVPDQARTSLKGVLAVSLCLLVQLLLTFRPCHSIFSPRAIPFSAPSPWPRPLHGAPDMAVPLRTKRPRLKPLPPLSPSPRRQRYPWSCSSMSSQGHRPPSSELPAYGAAQSCIGGSTWLSMDPPSVTPLSPGFALAPGGQGPESLRIHFGPACMESQLGRARSVWIIYPHHNL
jgi:hypothetical protein